MAAATLQQTSADLKKSRAVLHHLSDSFQSIQSHLFSIMALSDQWGTFQNSFVSVQQSLGSHIRELETKERETNSLRIALENREKEVELRRKKLDFDEKSLSEECTAFEMKERDYSERIEILELEKKRVKEWFKAAEAKARRVEERNVAVERREREVEAKERREGCRDVEEREKRVEERLRAVELREKEVDQRSEAVEVVENGINKRCIEMERREKEVEERCGVVGSKEEDIGRRLHELELKERRIDERFEEIELKEKRIDERFEEVELREKGVDVRFEEVGLMEKGIDERFDEVGLREKRVNERFEEVKLREKGIDEVCKLQELREKELSEQGNGLELKEKEIMERLGEMELKKKEIDERCNVVELREAEIDQCCKAQDLRDKQLNEKCKELELKQKSINERLGELELKEKEIDERCSVVELKEKAIEERCIVVESRESEIDERFKGQELREKQLNKRCKGLGLKEKRIDGRLKELELKENQLELKLKKNEEACEELELKEKRMLEHSEEIKLKDKQISEKFGSLELKEKHINENFKSLDSKVERLNNQSKDLALREKAVSDRSKALDLKEKKVNEQSRALELKEKEISKPSKEEELGESQRDVHINALVLKAKKINKCFQEQECKKNGINDPCAKLELKGKQLSDAGGMEMKSKPNSSLGIGEGVQSLSLKQCVTDGKALQMFLNDRVNEHRFMEEEVRDALRLSPDPGRLVLAALVGFFAPHLNNGDVMYETSAVRSSCVLLLEQWMNLKHKVDKSLKRDAKKVYFLWKEKMREEGESRIVVLSLLLLLVAFRFRSIIDRGELQRLYAIVDQDRIAPRLRLELDLFEENEGSNMATGNLEVTTKQQQSDNLQGTDVVVSSSIDHCSEIHSLCHRMDANGLRLYMRQLQIEQTCSPEKVLDALRCAPDPAKLLLNIVQTFNRPKATPVEKSNCIYLLEQLMKLQKQQYSINSLGQVEQLVKPPSKITLDLRNEAKKFAYNWKSTLAKNGNRILEVYGFLQFLATYEIACLFNEDELFQLFKNCYGGKFVFRPEQNPYLCRALGLEKRISGLIKSLVNEDRRLQAVKYICTFKMESYFPLAPLLKDHLNFTKKKSVKLLKGRKKSHAKVESARAEMHNLQDVLKLINDYELESEFTDVSLELRIEELKKKIDELKTSTTKVGQKVATERKEGLMKMVENNSTQLVKKAKNNILPPANSASELYGGKKRTSNSSPSVVMPQEKRLRTGAIESPALSNILGSWPQPGPCTSGHQANELPMLLSVTSPAINGSKSQSDFPDNSYGARFTPTPYRETEQIAPAAGICRGGIKAELKTTTAGVEQKLATERKADLWDTLSTNIEKDIVENNSTQLVKKAEKLLSPASSETVVGSFCGKFSSSPSSSVLPQQENFLRPHTIESPNPPNIPINTYSTPINPPLPSLQPWGQHRPYTFGHVAHDRPNGLNALHPGQMPSVNGPSGSYGTPGGSYGAPNGSYGAPDGSYGAPNGSYGGRGTGEFRPTAGIGPGSTPAPGQFIPNAGFAPGSTPAPGQFIPNAGFAPGSNPAPGQFRPTAEIGPGSTLAPGQFRPTAGIGPGGTHTPGQWPTAGIGPVSTPGQFRPTAGIGPDGAPAPGQYWPTTGSGSGGTPAPGQFWHNAGNGFGSTPAPGYFVGNHIPPYGP